MSSRSRILKVIVVVLFINSAACRSGPSVKPAGPTTGASPSTPAPQILTDSAPPVGLLGAIPIVLHDNRVVVNVRLNGKGPFAMIFDSSGDNLITPSVQRQLGLKSQGPDLMPGSSTIGNAKASLPSVHLRTVQMGEYQLQDQKFTVTDLSRIRRTFHFAHLDGVLGRELLAKVRVRLNFDQGQMELLSSTAPGLTGATQLKLEMINNRPMVEGHIDGHPAHIVIDTSDRSNLTLFRPFALSSGLAESFNSRERVMVGMSPTGPIPGKITTVQAVDLGSTHVRDVLTRMPLTRRGYFLDPHISASAGVGLLKGFNIEFDLPHQTLTLQTRTKFDEPSTFSPIPHHAL